MSVMSFQKWASVQRATSLPMRENDQGENASPWKNEGAPEQCFLDSDLHFHPCGYLEADTDSVGFGWGPIVCFSNKFRDDARLGSLKGKSLGPLRGISSPLCTVNKRKALTT